MESPVWFSNLVFWSLQVALLGLAAGFLPRALKLRQPRVLLAYWRSLLAVSLLLPFVQPWHRPQNVAATVISSDFAGVPLPPPSSAAPARWHLPSLQTVAPILGVVILVGIALRFGIFTLGLLKLRRLRQTSRQILASAECANVLQAVHALVATPAEFRLSAEVDSPVTFGVVAPVVLLPERFASLDPRFQSAIACHELLHVRRHDWVHHLGEEVLRPLFWFHPAVAWLISRVRLAREQVVDLEVVRLTSARKPYLEALLEFTNSRASFAAIPAPPFLAERQLIERVALMLKEVRMSRKRLIVSLTAISCCLVLVIALAAWTFPLRGAPLAARPALRSIAQQSPDAAAPKLLRIGYMPHDFDDADWNDNVWHAIQTRMKQLPGHLTLEAPYDQARADAMKKVLEDFWAERGITVEVRTSLTPYPRSARYAILQFDVYKQTILPGKLEGGVAGGIAGGIAQGISRSVAGGVSKGIAGGVTGGISGAVSTHASSDEPSVDYSTIWLDTVKRGAMPLQVRGMGTLVRAEGSATLIARVTIPAFLAVGVKPGQNAATFTEKGLLVNGHVSRVIPYPSITPVLGSDTRTVDIALDAVPAGASAGLEVNATIDYGRLDNVLYIGRPVNGGQNASIDLFKIINNGAEAVRTRVKLGRASATTIEVLDGLKEGDKVIISDMSSVAGAEGIRLTDEKHLSSH